MQMKTKILFVSLMNSDPWGGSEELWFKVALWALDQNCEVTCLLYFWKEKEPRLAALRSKGAKIIMIPNDGRKKRDIFERLRYEWITKLQQSLFLKRFRFAEFDHVLFNQGGFMELANSPWKHLYHSMPTYSIMYHNYVENFVFRKAKATALVKWLLKASHNFFASERGAYILAHQLSLDSIPSKTVFINPISDKVLEYSNSCQIIANKESSVFIFIVLAALDVQRKAQDNLINALAGPAWRDREWVLKIYGEGRDITYLRDLVRQQALDDRVLLMGKTNQVDDVLREADLFLQITHIDAIPISLVEALAMGKPAIVSNIGDMCLWVKDGINGWVSKDASVEAIQATLELAWAHREAWSKMGKASFNFFQTKYPEKPESVFFNVLMSKHE